jgi:hypothetical protein
VDLRVRFVDEITVVASPHRLAAPRKSPSLIMAWDYTTLKLAHVLLFAYWLGADLAVFYASRFVCDAKLSPEARATALKIMLFVDMAPRLALVLMLPVGLTLAASVSWVSLSTAQLLLLWIASGLWLLLVWSIHHFQGHRRAKLLMQIDVGLRLLVILALLSAGVGTLLIDDFAFNNAPWLALKALAFALIVFCGLMIRWRLRPLGPAFGAIMAKGSHPAAEVQLTRAIAQVKPWVIVIWLALILAAWIGIAKPYF